MRSVCKVLLISLLVADLINPVEAARWSTLFRPLRNRAIPMAVVRYGERDLLDEMAPKLISSFPNSMTDKYTLGYIFYNTAKKAKTGILEKKSIAEFTLNSGKIKVNSSFKLGPLEIKAGEFDLKKWSIAAAAGYILCAKGKSLSEISEKTFERCMSYGVNAAAESFGWKNTF